MSEDRDCVLIINNGSSSIKFAVYTLSLKIVYTGMVSGIGGEDMRLKIKDALGTTTEKPLNSHELKDAANNIIDWLESALSIAQIHAVGHRIVHGMQHMQPEIITDALISELESYSWYDPDHIVGELILIRTIATRCPGLKQVACFDTSFHASMPRIARLFPIPRHYAEAGIIRYGFHGISFTYILQKIQALITDTHVQANKMIFAHLGSGSSLVAVKEGKSIDTTMGFTPAGGCMMGTRSRDLDPGVVWHIMQHNHLSVEELNHVINHQSGLLGISGTSFDMEKLLAQEKYEDLQAGEAVDMYCYSVKKWLGALAAVLNGMDILIFTGGIGENSAEVRKRICADMGYMGIKLDGAKNERGANAYICRHKRGTDICLTHE
ncbi:acetate/propionate family kinase [Rhizosphaericola mali]|uniref:Acetate kinase n=1 Tax=Rhizosphaericola mali TaxID=2545455 RepID=A0A5P2FWX3_9BACT|nr:acetate/propionate family kinase [Rhizosphaericola mali]QES88024.1 acetate/propionate family kinase [Rhizosphaericola mali]